MRVRLTGRYRVLWGTRYWDPYPTLTIDPNSHPDHKTNQPTNQPNNQPTSQSINQIANQESTQPGQPNSQLTTNKKTQPPIFTQSIKLPFQIANELTRLSLHQDIPFYDVE